MSFSLAKQYLKVSRFITCQQKQQFFQRCLQDFFHSF